jgi:general secretion pathway protein D
MKRLVCLWIALAAAPFAGAQQQVGQRITPNFKDSDITSIAEAVSGVTGKNFIIDPRVRAQVTMLSSTPMSPDAFYEAFLAILQVHGFVAMPSGNIIKIVPDANARQLPGNDLPDRVSSTSDEFVTQVVAVKSVSAAQLVPVLRPLMAQSGQMAAYPASNILILSDRAANVNRLMRIIKRIDQEGDAAVEVVPLQNASAAEISRVVTSLYQQQAAENSSGSPLKLVADDRSNSVLISGDQSQRLRIKALIAHLDTPMENGGDTQVRYLQFADSEKIATKLKEQVTGVTQSATGAGAQAGPAAQAEKGTTIWADAETNSLIITAPPKTMRSLMTIVDRLDIRRNQVLVEAIIVEVSQDKSSELGVNWAAFSKDDDTRMPVGGFLSPVGKVSLIDLAAAADDPANVPAALANGTTLGIGRIAATGVNFAAMLRAIRGDGDSNVLATPSAITMDNQEAELKVAQEVPFITGSFTNTGATNGSTNPFQTVQREEVGTILKVTPQIASTPEGNSVVLKLSVESSSVAATSVSNVDITTNKRTITTNVLIEDGGIVVLGGLISNEASKSEQRVPYLGRIPIIGLAFKTRNALARKTNLMIFIRPKILRDGTQTAIETNSKYNYMREEQRKANHRELLPLLPGVAKPKLPEPPPVPTSGAQAPATAAEKEKASEDAAKARAGSAPATTPAPATESAPK